MRTSESYSRRLLEGRVSVIQGLLHPDEAPFQAAGTSTVALCRMMPVEARPAATNPMGDRASGPQNAFLFYSPVASPNAIRISASVILSWDACRDSVAADGSCAPAPQVKMTRFADYQKEATDEMLMVRYQRGHRDAFAALVTRHATTVFSVGYYLLGNEAQADETCTGNISSGSAQSCHL